MMKKWLLKLPVKLKLLLAFGSILIMSVLLLSVGISSIRNIIYYNDLVGEIENLNISTLQMSRNIQIFTDRGFKELTFLKGEGSRWVEAYDQEVDQLHAQLKDIKNHDFFLNNKNHMRYDSLINRLDIYESDVSQLINTYLDRGFKDYGVEGKLRSAIHDVEKADFPFNMVTMLTLRRHEKDFFLRKDLKYLDRFNTTINNFKIQIDSIDAEGKQQVLESVANYKTQFNYIVELEEKIGLDVNSGIQGLLNQNYTSIQSILSGLTVSVTNRKNEMVNTAMILLVLLLAVQIILGLILIIFYSNLLTKAINEIRLALVSLSKGRFPEKMIFRTEDEIAETKMALNNLVDRINTAVNYAQDLGQGNFNIEYDEKFRDDVLAKAIIQMKEQLVLAEKQQQAINWLNQGIAKLSEVLKNESENIEVLSDKIIIELVKYLDVNQGALYLLDDEQRELKRVGTYAYGKKKYVDETIKVGQGLVGQCVLEKSHIHLTDIPKEYIKITSGLGDATASNLLIVPLMKNDKVMGVVEFASFKRFSDLHIRFLNEVSENIATILVSKHSAEQTISLLNEANEKAALLSSHEEELKQNAEELQATQEEMERQKEELQQTIVHLKKELLIKEGSNSREELENSQMQYQ